MTGLNNKILAITRNENEAREFSRIVSAEGGRAIALPTIEIVPQGPRAVENFLGMLRKGRYDYCAFMSSQAVNVLFGLASAEQFLPALGSTEIIAVGPKTRTSLEERGVTVKLVPAKFSSRGLVKMLSGMQPSGKKIIIPRSGAAGDSSKQALTRLGLEVDEIPMYTVRASRPSAIWREFSSLLHQQNVDAVIFTSASSVESFFEIMSTISDGRQPLGSLTKVISLGPFTSRKLKSKNVQYSEAEEHTVEGALNVARRVGPV